MTRYTTKAKQRILNWLLADEQTYLPETHVGPNSLKVGSRDITDEDNSTTIYDGSAEQIGDGSQSVSTDRGVITRFASDNESGPIETASEYATGGDGSSGNKYTGGAIRSAVDAVQSNSHSGDIPRLVFIDGQFDENLSLPDSNGVTLWAPNWEGIIEPSTGYSLTIGDGTDEQMDVTVDALSLIFGDQKAVKIDNANEVQFFGSHLFGGLDATASSGVWIDNCEISDKDAVLNGCEDWHIDNTRLFRGCSLTLTDDSGTDSKEITLGSLKLEDNSAVEIMGASEVRGDLLMRDGFNTLYIDNGAADCTFTIQSNAARNDDVKVVNGSRITILGGSNGASNASIEFGSSATECVANGNFREWINNGTRCVINGVGYNAGDPSSTGDWNGNASLAHDWGATIYDTSVSPSDPYVVDDSGNWIKIGS